MDLLTMASALWLETHTLKLSDLELIVKHKIYNEKDWFGVLSNQALKDYLRSHPHWQQEDKKQIDQLYKHKISYVNYFSEDYPESLLNIDSPPLFFTYIGSIQALQNPSLTVVGTRDPSLDACHWLETYFYQLVKTYKITVVSGAAIGIDQMAQSIATYCKCPTVAILPSGLGNVYPQCFEKQIEEILSTRGAVVSEYPFLQAMRKHHFYQRNRLIACLGMALLVVEAKRKSGSLITAKYALEMGRDVMVIPSSPFEKNRLGTLDLLFDGALPVRDTFDLVGYLEPNLTKSKKSDNHEQCIRNP
ncbi:MAG: DNA-protecting protein DprA [Bdellovibrionales bacterium]|nr:DNA-protecting protein DprA [Bdellovibrionales bacterium]